MSPNTIYETKAQQAADTVSNTVVQDTIWQNSSTADGSPDEAEEKEGSPEPREASAASALSSHQPTSDHS